MEHEIKVFYADFHDREFVQTKLEEFYNNGFSIMQTFHKQSNGNIMFILHKWNNPLRLYDFNEQYVNFKLTNDLVIKDNNET